MNAADNNADPSKHFPFDESFIDACGTHRTFRVDGRLFGAHWHVIAREVGSSDGGYEFELVDAPEKVLGRLRHKIQRELSTKYLDPKHDVPVLLGNIARGRVGWSSKLKSVALIIDGRVVTFDDIADILETHQGAEFELRIGGGFE